MLRSSLAAVLFTSLCAGQGNEIQQAITKLQSSDDARAKAILQRDVAAAVPLLVDAIGADENARRRLSEALAGLGDAAVPAWLEAVQNGPAWRRYHAIRAIDYVPRDTAHIDRLLVALVPLLGDAEESIAYIAGYTITVNRGDSEAVVDALTAQMGTAERTTCIRTAVILGDLRHQPRIPWAAIAGGLEDSNSGYRYTAFKIVMDGDFDLALWQLAHADPHRWLRDAAAHTAWMLPSEDQPTARDALVAMLETPPPAEWNIDTIEEWRLHTATVKAAPRIGELAIPLLRTALARPRPVNPDARAACTLFHATALEAIAELGPSARVLEDEVLRHITDVQSTPATRRAAGTALLAILDDADLARHLEAMRDVLRSAYEILDNAERSALVGVVCAGFARLGGGAQPALDDLRKLIDDEACAAHGPATELAILGPDDAVLRRARRAFDSSATETSGHIELCAALAGVGKAARECAEPMASLHEDATAPVSVRRAATTALGEIAGALRATDPELADALTGRLRGKLRDKWLSSVAARAVAAADPDVGLALVRMNHLDDHDRRILGACVRADPARYSTLLDDTSEVARGRAAATLGAVGEAARGPLLAVALDPALRDPATVIRVITQIGAGPEFLPALRRFAQDPNLRSLVVAALEQMGTPAVPALRDLLSLETMVSYGSVLTALGDSAERFLPDLAALAEAATEPEQVERIASLMMICGARGIEAARKLPLGQDEFTELLQTFATRGSNTSALPAALALASERVMVPGAAKRLWRYHDEMQHLDRWLIALAAIDPASEATADLLIQAMSHPSARLRRDAIRLLAPSTIEEQIARIDAHLHLAEFDPDQGVRAAATAARETLRVK